MPAPEATEPEPALGTERRERRSWLQGLRRRGPGEAVPPDNGTPEETGPEASPERAPLRAVEPLRDEPDAEPEARPPSDPPVVRLSSRRPPEPREWNLWDLESVAREEGRDDPARREEWSYLFLHLRQFADAKGTLPADFDSLIRESFGDLLEIHELT
jgi:hypothetical protein